MPCWFALLTAEGERRTVALGRAEVLGGGYVRPGMNEAHGLEAEAACGERETRVSWWRGSRLSGGGGSEIRAGLGMVAVR
ncbi:hypothetical protein M0R45_030628 [Rubus argutus]|uniref:Uncharacterized protein n=1 Tax=Rubus argutus TaxID=59490 RepID=A0AAW1WC37_RUBAR